MMMMTCFSRDSNSRFDNMDTERLDEIRHLLHRYYNGTTTRDETSRLVSLLRDFRGLPPSLEADRRLVLMLETPGADEMPVEMERRVTQAVESAIRRAGRRTMPLRRLLTGASVIAACLLTVLAVALRFSSGRDEKDGLAHSDGTVLTVPGVGSPSGREHSDTLVASPPAEEIPAVKPTGSPDSSRKMAMRRKTTPPRHAGESAGMKARRDDSKSKEVDEWIAENYRVVEDPREARAIMGSVVAVMQSNIIFDEVNVASACDRMGTVIPISY